MFACPDCNIREPYWRVSDEPIVPNLAGTHVLASEAHNEATGHRSEMKVPGVVFLNPSLAGKEDAIFGWKFLEWCLATSSWMKTWAPDLAREGQRGLT